jgi:hypothetical protein
MSTAQSNDFLIIETHAAEDGAQVLVALRAIWETPIRCACGHFLVNSASTVWDDGTLHFLDGNDTAEDPEVRVGDPWELLCGQNLAFRSTN